MSQVLGHRPHQKYQRTIGGLVKMGSDRNIDKYILILALCSSLIALLFAGITYAICIYCFGIFLYGGIGCICTIKKKHYVRALVYLPLIILSFVALLRELSPALKK